MMSEMSGDDARARLMLLFVMSRYVVLAQHIAKDAA